MIFWAHIKFLADIASSHCRTPFELPLVNLTNSQSWEHVMGTNEANPAALEDYASPVIPCTFVKKAEPAYNGVWQIIFCEKVCMFPLLTG